VKSGKRSTASMARTRRKAAASSTQSAASRTTPVHGWRVWHVGRQRGAAVLTSVTFGVIWPSRKPMRAHCIHAWARGADLVDHNAPGWSHTCGIYALDDLERTNAWGAQGPKRVVGGVSLWGRLIVAEHGYRAEYAYPHDLWIPDSGDDVASSERLRAELAARYAVEVRVGEPSGTVRAAGPSLLTAAKRSTAAA
jgi:hypothetical protein